MNKLQILELLEKHHPHLSNKQSELYLESAANIIAEETLVTKRTWLINSVAGQRWYNLDASIIKIEKVYFNDVMIPRLVGDISIDDDEFTSPADSSDIALATPIGNSENKRFWKISSYDSSSEGTTPTDRLAIIERVNNSITRDGRTVDYQSCSVSGTSNIRVYGICIPPNFESSENNDTVAGPLELIPAQFHDVLLNGAIARGYKDPENINADLLSFFDGQFREGIKRIKKFERTKTTTGFIKPYDF
tara:strand:- start:244 stop:987 length:744 start_codon:yes stop_codon:yes gene_type:complete